MVCTMICLLRTPPFVLRYAAFDAVPTEAFPHAANATYTARAGSAGAILGVPAPMRRESTGLGASNATSPVLLTAPNHSGLVLTGKSTGPRLYGMASQPATGPMGSISGAWVSTDRRASGP